MSNETEIKIEGISDSITQAAQSVVAPSNELPMITKKRRFLRSDRSSYSFPVEYFGEIFYCLPMEREDIKEFRALPEKTREAIGWTQQQMRHLQLLERGATPKELGLTPEQLLDLTLTPEQDQAQADVEIELMTKLFVKYVDDWSLPQECNDKHKADADYDVLRYVCDKLQLGSIRGVVENSFRQSGDTTAGAR